MSALASAVAAINFRPIDYLVLQADERLQEAEGYGLERLVAEIYEERSRKQLPGFELTHRVEGYWDSKDTEIDLVVVNDEKGSIRFASCKRSSSKILGDLTTFEGHVQRFLDHHKKYAKYVVEKAAIAPEINPEIAKQISDRGWIAQDLRALTDDL